MRREKDFTITAAGRDIGKVFHLREMPATQAEKWAARAFLGMAKSGIDIPEDISSLGLAGIAVLGLKAMGGVSFYEAEPLLDEMMACVRFIPDPKQPSVIRDLQEDDIEEVATRLKLRMEVWTLHTGFSMSAGQSASPAIATDA